MNADKLIVVVFNYLLVSYQVQEWFWKGHGLVFI